LSFIKELLATFLYMGYSPVAPGTAGTAGAIVAAMLIPLSIHYGLACVIICLATLAIGVPLGNWAEKRWEKKDPGPFVIDEVAGTFIALFRIDAPKPEVNELIVAFLAFRLFDVVKPPPARRIERLAGGWGIMLDDIIAGLYALLAVIVYRQHFLGLPI
jgi:phosphatidylglycerophosphatase A